MKKVTSLQRPKQIAKLSVNLEGKKIPVERRAGEELQGRNMLRLVPSPILASGKMKGASLFFPHTKGLSAWWGAFTSACKTLPCFQKAMNSSSSALCFPGGYNITWVGLTYHPMALSFSKMQLLAKLKSSDFGIVSDFVRVLQITLNKIRNKSKSRKRKRTELVLLV